MRLDELDELDFGSWKNPWADLDDEAPDIDADARRVLTMRRLLETVRDYDRPVDLAIETKHPTRYAGLVERSLVQLLDEFGWAGRDSPARVMSFSRRALTRVKKLAPELEVVYLMYRQHALVLARELNGFDWIAGPGIELLRENPVGMRRLTRLGRRVHVWTVNSEQDLDVCLDLGVEAVITDRPQMVMGFLNGRAGDARESGDDTG
jgi:glycerophosphoryl diester phosphodiesterase